MKTMWEGIPCDYAVKKVEDDGWTEIIHNYDFGLFDFDEAARRFSRFSFETEEVIRKLKSGILISSGFTGGQRDQLNFKAVREADKVHVTMKEVR